MGITTAFDDGFYTGMGTSNQVPKVYPVSLNGRPYMIDMNQPFYRQYKRQLSPLLRTQADIGATTGEQSINPEDLWRRSQEDWSLGAGQTYLDRKESAPNRFRKSKGIDCWTKWQIGLLPDTTNIRASINTNLATCSAGSFFYVADGTNLIFTSDITAPTPAWTTVTGTPGVTISSLCSDGYDIWACCGPSGVYTTTAGATAATQYITAPIDTTAIIAFLKGRLMLASTNKVYNLLTAGALPTALFTHANPTFHFVGFADGLVNLYAAGASGDRSWVYGFAILSDGTAMTPPVVQGELPHGETITAIYGSTGFLFLGSIKGIRFATTDTVGAITIESLIPTPNPVTSMVGFDRFVWFSWTNYDTVSTGIGRMDLQNFAVPSVQPAYASDLMAGGQGTVTTVDTFQNQRVFTVAGLGVYTSLSTQLVAEGTIDSGFILFDLPDLKVALQLLVQSPVPLPAGSYQTFVAADGGPFVAGGTHMPFNADPVLFNLPQISAQRFEIRVNLIRDATKLTVSPTISRYTLKAWPAPVRPLIWQVPLILDESVVNSSSSTDGFDPLTELQALESMAASGQLVNFQEGFQSYPVLVTDVEFLPDYTTEDRRYFNGVALIQLKGVPPT